MPSYNIVQTSHSTVFDDSHAQHGLGTIFELLGKCAQARHDWQQARSYTHESITVFRVALDMRIRLFGIEHPPTN